MSGTNPRLTIQTASLYASGDTSTFTGTGGPFGFSPFTGQFGGVVSSAGLATESFNDAVYNVAPGDELTFVVAVQNLQAAAAYGVRLGDVMPTGFVVPTDGIGLSVTDGAGNELATSGDLFGVAGLTLTAPLAGYDANSGANVALVTFSLAAGPLLPGPYANLTGTAGIQAYAASAGGANLAPANPASATTTIVTAAPTPLVTPETDPTAVARGQTIAFDVSLAVPAGSLPDLTLAPIATPGASTLDLVSSSIVSVGAGLTTGSTSVTADGVIHLGTVGYTGTGSNVIIARVVVRADGTASGNATLQTVVSATDPNSTGGRWTANVASSVGVIVPPQPAGLSGLLAVQGIGLTATFKPFTALAFTGTDMTQTGTLTIAIQGSGIGQLGNPGNGGLDAAGDAYLLTGTLASLQAAARLLTYTAAGAGVAQVSITLVDASGGIAQDSGTSIVAVANLPPPPLPADPLFDATYYLAHNPDVAAAGVDPYGHYMTFGWHEGRNPNALFDTNFYLTHNPDVAAAGVNPLTHFESSGWHEGRDPSLTFSDSAYLTQNPDVAAANMDPLLHYSLFGQYEGRINFMANGTAAADPLVNPTFYASQLGAADSATSLAAWQQAAWNFDNGGWQRGASPDSLFDVNYYLSHNPDVAAAHINPLTHYEEHGWKEGRDPSAAFSTNKYLAAYSDVRAANFDPLLHYVEFGANEGRTAFAV